MQQRAVPVRLPPPWALAADWFSLNFQGAALMAIVVPRTLTRLDLSTPTGELARLAALVAAVAMVLPPIVGKALDSVPDLRNVARDLGIWGIVSHLPAVVAPLVGGMVLILAAAPAAGYRTLFLNAAGGFAAGSILVEASRPVRAPRRALQRLLTLAVALLLAAHLDLVYDVEVVGRLPADRASLRVVANHQHDLDGMVIPARLVLACPWRGAAREASSPGCSSRLATGGCPALAATTPGSRTSPTFWGPKPSNCRRRWRRRRRSRRRRSITSPTA